LPILVAGADRLGDGVYDDQPRIDACAFYRGDERLEVALLGSEIWRRGSGENQLRRADLAKT
jgi:hypothetical protein